MKNIFINNILQSTLDFLNNEQSELLKQVLETNLLEWDLIPTPSECPETANKQNLLGLFLAAKRREGCSEKSLKYYKKTVETVIESTGKAIKQITTDDLRTYLTDYQEKNNVTKVTVDNVRRILSSFFSWLEDENYILKSPVRRIHKVKTGSLLKETYTD